MALGSIFRRRGSAEYSLLREVDMKDVDALERLIGFGWYQLFHLLAMKLCDWVEIINMSFMMFASEVPRLLCAASNSSRLVKGDDAATCALIRNGTCGNLTRDTWFGSPAAEWGLICSSSSSVYLSESVQMFGVLLGAPLFGQISDAVGRRKAVLLSNALNVAAGFASSFAPNMAVFTVFRFFIGFFTGGTVTTDYVYRVEFIPQKHRVWAISLVSPLNFVWFAGFAYAFQDWRHLARYGNVVGLVPLAMIALGCRESPRWLIQKGRTEEAKDALRTVAKWNRDSFTDEELHDALHAESQKAEQKREMEKTRSFQDLFYSAELVRYSLVLPFVWFTASSISYGINFGVSGLAGSPYLSTLAFGLLRVAFAAFVSALDLWAPRFGRKHLHSAAAAAVVAICSGLTAIFVTGNRYNYAEVVRWGAITASCMSSLLWIVAYLCSAELYPTPVRNLANAYCSAWARLGGIIGPQVSSPSSLLWIVAYLCSAELYPTPVRNLANAYCSAWARLGGIIGPQVSSPSSLLWIVAYLCSAELYPTPVRNLANAYCSAWARLGGIIGPQVSSPSSLLWIVAYLCSAELYPTPVRNLANAYCSAWARLGGIIGPQVSSPSSLLWIVAYLCSAELYPTPVRNLANAYCSAWARLGGIIGPQVSSPSSLLWIVAYLCSAELYPTPVRNLANAYCSAWARLGGIIGPQVSSPSSLLWIVAYLCSAELYPTPVGPGTFLKLRNPRTWDFASAKSAGFADLGICPGPTPVRNLANAYCSAWARLGGIIGPQVSSPSSLLWIVAYLCSAELYPTPVRNLANAYCSAWARLGGIIGPQVSSPSSLLWIVAYLCSAELYPTPARNLANAYCSAWARLGGIIGPQVSSPSSLLWIVAYLCSAELYPTPVRNLANAYCSAWARLGGIIGPQGVWGPFPYVVYGSLAVVDGVAVLFLLPETKGRPMPEAMPPEEERLCALPTLRRRSVAAQSHERDA